MCTMFIVASFSVVGGIRTSTEKLKDNFTPDLYLLTVPAPSGPSFFTASKLSVASEKTGFGSFAICDVSPVSQKVTVFTIVDSNHVLPESLSASGTEVLTGVDLVLPLNVTLGSTPVTVIGKYSSALFPSDWIFGSQQLLQTLTGRPDAEFNFAISKGLTTGDIATLRADGLSVQPMTGIIPFLDSGVSEIEDDATWVLVPSSFVIAVLAYAFTGSETADRRHDIGIVKTIGAGRRRVMSYLVANALLISAWGGLLGLALGIILSYGVSTLASSMFTSVFVIKASASLLVLSYVATVAAGVAGAAIPAAKMTLSSPVSDLKEVTPSS